MGDFQLYDFSLGSTASTVVQGQCPGCGALTNFLSKRVARPGELTDIIDAGRGSGYVEYGVRFCPSCNHVIFFRREKFDNNRLFIYPPPQASFNINHVPEEIQADAREAIACFRAGANKATVIMCRRTLQSICKSFSASGTNLKSQIDDLKTKDVINKALADWAHQIRHLGNAGAHPDDDLSDISADDAAQTVEFMKMLSKYIYEMPALLAEAQQRTGKQ